ncbi:type I DNA topoisomerase [bacterium]|nr:MAG: type I DNA topoisomerase [bacterium]
MSKNLVIVESPSKAKTIKKYLGSDYVVEATVGHIKNLPKNKINVDIENGFKPFYDVIPGKENIIKSLVTLASKAEQVFIATDPDREGEAIASDIAGEIKGVNKKIKRVLFNEITKSGVETAMKHPRDIDENLVSSQMARRIMDRILGYKVSPFLWKTFYYGLSAGRVQSVALKLICEREEEIMNFVPKEYWSIDGIFSKLSGNSKPFNAKLYKINDEIIKYNGDKPCIENITEAHGIIDALKGNKFKVIDIQLKEAKRNSPAPFTTSVLQQTASTKLGFSPGKTMTLAQKLYEGIEISKAEGNVGLKTYMRTDSTRVSGEAIAGAGKYIDENFGPEYKSLNNYSGNGKAKNTQDAHEAIRPTDVFRSPDTLKKLDKNLLALYTLIWKRFIASQMSQAVFEQKTVLIKALSPRGDARDFIFKATGSDVLFSGYLKVYEDTKDDSDNSDSEDLSVIPKDLKIADMLNAFSLMKEQHFTNPPPRYTESSLIKQLDNLGIGRPSTFASIVSTVIDRKYVDLVERKLFATNLGLAVDKMLVEHFVDVINTDFTASMEEELDTIANGECTYEKVLQDFYIPFNKDLAESESQIDDIKKSLIVKTEIDCPECGKETGSKMLKKWGRNGQFLTCQRYPKCKATMSVDETVSDKKTVLGIKCDKCGADMLEKVGRYGKFYGCSNYPKCDGIKPVTLGIKCPKCNEGEVLTRRGGKRFRMFYGCTRYPDCNFIENSKPIIKNCDSCGNNYLVEKETKKDGKFLYCTKCKAKIILEEVETAK